MALKLALTLTLLLHSAAAFPELYPAADSSNTLAAFKVLGNLTDGFAGFDTSQLSLFERQSSCKQGYNQCGFIGECCPVDGGDNCCGTSCKASRPAGTECCSGYMCPPKWSCCGTSGNGCSPTEGTCCSSDGRYCPENWSCCGDQGGCYPSKDFHCCSNDGKFCPDGYQCVTCSGNSTEVCCEGTGGAQIPVYETKVPEGTSITSLPIPSVTGKSASTEASSSKSGTTSGEASKSATTPTNAAASTSATSPAQQSVTPTKSAGSGSGASGLRMDAAGLLVGLIVAVII